jgi:hypothetical protein
VRGAALLAAGALAAAGCPRSHAPAGESADAAPSASASAPASATASSSAAAAIGAPPAGAAAPTSTAVVHLLDAGHPPLRKLRYAWRIDRPERLAMDLRTEVSTQLGTVEQKLPLPPVHITVDVDPKSVSPDGDLRYTWHVTSATTSVAPGEPSQLADGMRAEVATVARLRGTATVTARGLCTELTVDPDSVVDAGAGTEMVEQVSQQLRDLAAPFPEEEVGKGARWQKLSQIDSRDARVTQTETFTLTDVQGDRGTLDDVLAQTAPSQPLLAPGVPPHVHARMDSMLASGDARTRFDLTRLVPRTSYDGTTTMVVSGSLGDGSRRVTMVMRVGIVLQGTAR